MKNIFLSILSLCSLSVIGQSDNITTQLYDTYENYKEGSIGKRRIKRTDIQPLIDNLSANSKFKVHTVGKSIGGKDLSLISIGRGETDVFLWSQMHGNEPTATQAIFDILNFFDSPDFKKEKEAILANLTVHFLPMLNPDGAELYQRRNLLGIDINRDALRLQSPESQTLKRVRDSLDADFGFNLHDQSTYYNAERTEKPATISYLAPAYNYEKDINETRGNAMKIIVFMNDILQKYAPGQVGRYNDDFEPRAFGDNIQKWGTSTILIESGGFPEDVEKQEIRKLNYTSILSAIYTIAQKSYEAIGIEEYEKIPENDRKLFDLKIVNASYELMGNTYTIDIGMNQIEVDYPDHNSFWYSSRILDQGDLSTYYGYETLDATGYTIKQAKVYPKTLNNFSDIQGLNFTDVLKQGYGYLRLSSFPAKNINSPYPVHLIGEKYTVPELNLMPGINPTFFLEKDGVIAYAVINGFLVDLNKPHIQVPNAMIFR
ncbi:M14 metallopeptidase family protein [Maribacter sp. 1_MG-2023]|uniref:M14 family metallopeptidase n=1 Tax=Maribacter sp. 1_MG-2023 TaxID=3062677 RepID=UPI0026E2CCB5|nr:M14 metallopeptidase family protein [Maribacter sp. 1_MG-2023]MDO6473271.1 M14 family metallopeptidase [Maribacter sp. 1_MG-2023]